MCARLAFHMRNLLTTGTDIILRQESNQGGYSTTFYTQDENTITFPVQFSSAVFDVVPIYVGGLTQAVSPFVRQYSRDNAILIYRCSSRYAITIATWFAMGR